MLTVSSATKSAYKTSSNKVVTITIGQDTYNTQVVQESLEIQEILENNKYLQFSGCNASMAKFSLYGVTDDYKGASVSISIVAYDSNGEPTDTIPLFHGIVDEQTTKNYTTSTCEFVCYDILYTLRSIDVAEWYIATVVAGENITVKDFRDSLFAYLNAQYQLGITVETATLVNDNIEFTKQFSPVQMCALDIIKYICQLNCVYGIINRAGNFEFRTLPTYNSNATYEIIEYYKSLDYQRYTVSGIGKVIVRQTDQVEGVSHQEQGASSNTYIMQGNFFTMGMENEELQPIADNVYSQIIGKSYVPFVGVINGYPWIEVGDIVIYKVFDYINNDFVDMPFYVLSRDLTGIVGLYDTQKAEGEKERSIFLSDVGAKIDTIKEQIEQIQGSLNTIALTYTMFYNQGQVIVSDTTSVKTPVASTALSVNSPSQARIDMEYLLQCTATTPGEPMEVTLFYELDGTIIDSRTPKETWTDGDHILHTYYVVDLKDTAVHTWRTFLQCDGGRIVVPKLNAMNTILALGTQAKDIWDGTINAEDILDNLVFNGAFIGSFTDSVETSFQQPTRGTINENMSALVFGNLFSAFIDSVEFARVVDNYTLDTTSTVTMDDDYVTTENNEFALITEWIAQSEDVIIDSGYCTKVTPFIDGVTVTDVEIS